MPLLVCDFQGGTPIHLQLLNALRVGSGFPPDGPWLAALAVSIRQYLIAYTRTRASWEITTRLAPSGPDTLRGGWAKKS